MLLPASIAVVVALAALNHTFYDYVREIVTRLRHEALRQPDGLDVLGAQARAAAGAAAPVVLLTGANGGIGQQAAVEFARRGFALVVTCRTAAKAAAVVAAVKAAVPGAEVDGRVLDVSSLAAVRRFVAELGAQQRVDVLINNAAVMGVARTVTEEGFELQLATNYLGPALLTWLLLPRLREAQGRVVMVSSSAHGSGAVVPSKLVSTDGYRPMRWYANSKLAILMLAFELHRRHYKQDGVASVAVHPGIVDTGLWDHVRMPAAVRGALFKSPQRAARAVVYAALAPVGPEPLYTGDCTAIGCARAGTNTSVAAELIEATKKVVGVE